MTRARKSVQHPTDGEKRAMLAVVSLASGWFRETNVPPPALADAFIAATRAYLDGDGGIAPMLQAQSPLRNAAPVTHAEQVLNEACIVVLVTLRQPAVHESEFADVRRALFAKVEFVGTSTGHNGVAPAVRLAWDDAMREYDAPKRGTMPEPRSPEHARLILRGILYAVVREQRQLSAVKCSYLAGLKSETAWTRIENGTATPEAACSPRIARSLGVDVPWMVERLSRAYGAAETLAGLATGVQGERWYADLCALAGETHARAFLATAAVSAVFRDGA